ncbi:hypothetical protein SLUN_00215 [Streptomyces lunaelactis]|uniref:ParA family protein n=1 Tax=Streptomyces lunaelactis TaxID=1535768 RepID=A0A2R4SVN8_9ACTN|nr:hypothetical protein [Streptomyces lunaelactis]AVZ70928.1 hypothetical protein SLUN_00215 [Streptomyces lunaelactis]NUK27889.1 hypothetical protein [Streptomyces lunaelactis]NUK85605.1 hypothetical protein [Streptomyces lunaelactis]
MAVIALVGLPGAPGVTSTALALLRTWPLGGGWRLVLAECDPDGGAILPGALSGRVPADRGLPNLAVSSRTQELVTSFWTQLMALTGEGDGERSRLLLPGLTEPGQAPSLGPVWSQLADLFVAIEEHQHDVLIDLGRDGAFGPSSVLARRADAVVVVVRGTLRSVHAAKPRIAMLRALLDGDQRSGTGSEALSVLLITEGPYGTREVEEALNVPVIATLPHRPKEAAVLSDGAPEDRRFAGSELMRAARTAVDPIQRHVSKQRARIAAPLHQWLGVVADAR